MDVTVPELGEDVTQCTLARWLVQTGDSVQFDQSIVELTSDKVDLELPAPCAGRVLELCAQEGAVLNVGATLARIQPAEQ